MTNRPWNNNPSLDGSSLLFAYNLIDPLCEDVSLISISGFQFLSFLVVFSILIWTDTRT